MFECSHEKRCCSQTATVGSSVVSTGVCSYSNLHQLSVAPGSSQVFPYKDEDADANLSYFSWFATDPQEVVVFIRCWVMLTWHLLWMQEFVFFSPELKYLLQHISS